MEIEKLYYTITEAAKIIGCHRQTLYKKANYHHLKNRYGDRFKKLTIGQILQIKKDLPLNLK